MQESWFRKTIIVVALTLFTSVIPGSHPVWAQDFQALLNAVDQLEANLQAMVDQEAATRKQQFSGMESKMEKLARQSGGTGDPAAFEQMQKEILLLKMELKNLALENTSGGSSTIDHHLLAEIQENLDYLKTENLYLSDELAHMRGEIEQRKGHLVAVDDGAYDPSFTDMEISHSGATVKSAVWWDEIGIGVENAYFSKYVWRGLLLTDDPVMQPSGTFDYNGFSFNLWANMDGGDANRNRGQINELDWTIGYSWEMAQFGLDAGVVHYTFPNTDYAVTTELYLGVGFDAALDPTVTASWDIDQVNGWYIALDLGHAIDLPLNSDVVAMSVEVAAGAAFGTGNYNEAYYGTTSGGMTDFHFGLSLPVSLGDHFSAALAVGYSAIINSDIKKQIDNDHLTTIGVVFSAGL